MENSLGSRLKNAWNAFMSRDPTYPYRDIGAAYSSPLYRPKLTRGNERSIVNSVYNRIALDVASIDIKHVRVDDNERYVMDIKSGLNNCLTLDANIDQTSRTFIHDAVISMMDEGVVALIPVDTSKNPRYTESYDIYSMRTGKVLDWYPNEVKCLVYNERTGKKEEIMCLKRNIGIVENPYRAVMNEPNSVLQRLIRKLNILDVIDEQSGSGKLDLIIQLPYVIKSDARKKQANDRRKDIEDQLKGPYGIAYVDGTEKITQLNRPVENNLMKQIEYLTSMLYSQLGIDPSVLENTADEKTMLNYMNGPIEKILTALVEEMSRKFLSKTARSQGQSIRYFRDPFKLVPVSQMAEIADKFTRNEIMSSNEIRQVVGMKPSDDPAADELRNKNLNRTEQTPQEQVEPIQEEEIQNGV